MSPYAARFCSIVGALLVSGFGLKVFETLSRATVPSYVFWAFGAFSVGAYCVFYFVQRSHIEDLCIYVPIKRLKKPNQPLQKALRLANYHKYYGQRDEDESIRRKLKDNGGILVVGSRLSGKTRTALEAILAVKPNGHLLSFTNPDEFRPANIKNLIIPCFFVVWKPEVVVFFDDIDKFSGTSSFRLLLSRLYRQVSSVSVVATCHDGGMARVRSDPEIEHLLKETLGPMRLEPFGPNSKVPDEIYRRVWKGKTPPLVQDKTLPGKIVLGSEYMRQVYLGLGENSKRTITALGLAARCGSSPCEEAFLRVILKEVLGRRNNEFGKAVQELEEKGFIFVRSARSGTMVAIQHDSYLDEDYMEYYGSIVEFKRDLRQLEGIMIGRVEPERLIHLGIYYADRLQDSEAARRVIKEGAAMDSENARYQLILARLYARRDESDLADQAIQKCLELVRDQNERALALASFADELLYSLNQTQEGAKYYKEAHSLAMNETARNQIAIRYADCLIKNREYAAAEPFYRDWYARGSDDDKMLAGSRLLLTVIGQDEWVEARDVLRGLWKGTAIEAKLKIACDILNNAQGCFEAAAQQLERTYELVWLEFRDWALESPRDSANNLMAFAETMLIQGFLEAAVLAHRYLVDEQRLERQELISVLVNFGAAFRDLRKFDEARHAFQRAIVLCEDSPRLEGSIITSQAGMADCDLMQGQNISEARRKYEEAHRSDDRSAKFWGSLGLGDIYVLNGSYHNAERAYKTLSWIPSSYGGESRLALGLARAYLALGQFDDAESYVVRGFLLPYRHGYAYRLEELQVVYAKIREERSRG